MIKSIFQAIKKFYVEYKKTIIGTIIVTLIPISIAYTPSAYAYVKSAITNLVIT